MLEGDSIKFLISFLNVKSIKQFSNLECFRINDILLWYVSPRPVTTGECECMAYKIE